MTIPKWLLPAISIVAALAVGVALFLIGNRFAAPATVEKAGGTIVVPVLQPTVSGVTAGEAKQLHDAGKLGASPVSGKSTVAVSAGAPTNSSLRKEVEQVAHQSAPSRATTPTPGPTPSDAASPGITILGGTTPPAADPCAPTDGKIPIGCPSGLRSRIYADTSPSPLVVTISPYSAPCGTAPSLNARGTATNIPVLVETNVPSTLTIGYSAFNPNPNEPGQIPVTEQDLSLPRMTTDPTQAAAWYAALESGASLPPLQTCITLSDRWPSGTVGVEVDADSDFGQRAIHVAWLDSAGVPVPQGVRVQEFGTSDFVAYADYPTNQRLQIQAYGVPSGVTGSCENLTPLTALRSAYSVAASNYPISSNEPPDYIKRESIGYQVAPGTSTLVCAKWFHGSGSASYDRTTPIRQSSVIVESPDLDVPQLFLDWFTGEGPHAANIDDNRVGNIRLSAATAEGVPCGSEIAYSSGHQTFGDSAADARLKFCDLPIGTTARYDASSGGYTNVLTSGDLVVTSTVTALDGSVETSEYRLPTGRTVCDDCGDQREDMYSVPLPGINARYQPVASIGRSIISARWHRLGRSGVDQWTTIPQYELLPGPVIDGPPQLDTDWRMTPDHLLSTTSAITARLDLQVNEDADYRITLTSLDGSAPCLLSGGTGVATGHYTGTAEMHVYVPKLCFGALYIAVVTLTNSHGTTTWGSRAGAHPWAGSLLATPPLSATVRFDYTVTPPSGKVLTDLDMHVDHSDLDPAGVLMNGCRSGAVHVVGTASMQLVSHPVLHVHYRLRNTAAGSSCAAASTDATMAVDRDVPIDLAAVEANPTGYRVTVGPLVLTITVTGIPFNW